MRDATSRNLRIFRIHTFKSTHPYAGCDDLSSYIWYLMRSFKSTHPYAGCDSKTQTQYVLCYQSYQSIDL